ncbi:hypothetical protein NQ176_g5026 [Zarea fungicola]|uniref:Uncharacterized protein n=1 Tax=Zarea fungicola TaxID=93591 RepID=A0ACC1NC00_9HYPO|nr:hypothetical protein NQ176_g5026 [Lecanicillium fungicola]
MNAVAVEESRYVRGAEDISFLHLLHHVPEQPSVNTLLDLDQINDAYILSAKQELRLASSIAFLSGITDNRDHVTAVCVQEEPKQGQIYVLLAINKKKFKDGKAILTEICGALSGIFERLSRPAEGNCETDCFTQIVKLCKTRILCRLGYEACTYKDARKTIEELLENARTSLVDLGKGAQVAKMRQYKDKSASLTNEIAYFLAESTTALRLIREWSGHQEDARLCGLIDGLCGLAAAEKLDDVIGLIPNALMDPSSRQSLVNMILKCSRYRAVARILYRAAKKTPIARRLQAVPVQLPNSAFQKTQSQSTVSSLQDAAHRVMIHQSGAAQTLERVCQAIKKPVPDAEAVFQTRAQKTLHDGKFHAEVQLVHHVLANPSMAPPRFVCSSKDACFLCNMLIQAYGKMQTPKCHGRLYPGWRLPRTAEFMALQSTMNAALEAKIRESVNALLDRSANRRIQLRDPCESTYFAFTRSSTTIPQRSEVSKTPSSVEINLNGGAIGHSSSGPNTASTSTITIPHSAQRSTIEPCPSTAPPSLSIRQSYAIAQGEVVSASVENGRTSELYTSPLLELQLEFTTQVVSVETHTPKLGYQIQQLTSPEAQSLRADNRIAIIDASSLPDQKEQTCKLYKGRYLYIGVRDCIFRLTLNPTGHSDE